MTRREILARHRESLRGTLRACYLPSPALGINKSFYVYEPPGFNKRTPLPLLYLFRGHEREWVNINEDSSRQRATAIEDIDKAIELGMIPPVLAVMPGLNSSNNHVPSLGVNMAGTWKPSMRGLGSGRFWDFLTGELFPAIKKRYPAAGSRRLAAGFSLGGFTTSLLTIRCPELFTHVGIYDGLFMWPGHEDPRKKPQGPGNDTVWTSGGIFDPAFGKPRNQEALAYWNPTDTLMQTNADTIKSTTWWVSCAPADGQHGNHDRASFYHQLLKDKGITQKMNRVVFDEQASHSWHWADKFLLHFLVEALADCT